VKIQVRRACRPGNWIFGDDSNQESVQARKLELRRLFKSGERAGQETGAAEMIEVRRACRPGNWSFTSDHSSVQDNFQTAIDVPQRM
jgi:hypothetical protein